MADFTEKPDGMAIPSWPLPTTPKVIPGSDGRTFIAFGADAWRLDGRAHHEWLETLRVDAGLKTVGELFEQTFAVPDQPGDERK